MALLSDIRIYAAAVAPEDDVTTQIGGAPDLTKKHDFVDFFGPYAVVSSDPADTTQTVTLTYRDLLGAIVEAAPVALAGQTLVAGVVGIAQIMKAVKSGTCAGDVALVPATVALQEGTAQGPGSGTDTLQLDATASAVDDTYVGGVVRLTFGAGAGELARIIAYVGATKTATMSRAWTVPPTSTTQFRISDGIVFDTLPSEILSVVRLFYNAVALVTPLPFYQKVFFKNVSASKTLTVCEIAELAGQPEVVPISFDLDPAVNSASDNGVGNGRLVAPAGYVFGDASQSVPGGRLKPGWYIGVWLELAVPAGLGTDVSSTYAQTFSSEAEV